MYYSPIDRFLKEDDIRRGLGVLTPLGYRRDTHRLADDGALLGCLQSGDKSQLRRSGFWPCETKNAVFISMKGRLYTYNMQPCSRDGMRRSIEIAVHEWKTAHGVTR